MTLRQAFLLYEREKPTSSSLRLSSIVSTPEKNS